MKEIRYFIILQMTFLILFSCDENRKIDYKKEFENKDGFKVISINVENEEAFLKTSEYIANIDLVRLQTNRDCMIGAIDKIEIDNNYIYILDIFISNSLFVFRKNGEFVKRIGQIGKGPGEYTAIWDFRILDDERLLILDFTYNKLMFYDNFNFTHSKKMKSKIQSVTEKDSFFYFKLLKRNNINDFDLLITNDEFKTVKEEFATPPNSNDAYNIRYGFRNYIDSITYVRPFDNKVYRLKGKKMTPKYYFDFGDKKMAYKDANFSDSENLNNIPFLNGDYYESDKCIIFNFVYENYVSTGFYNKITGEVKHSKSVSMDMFKGDRTRFINSNEKSLFGVIEARDIKHLEKATKKKHGLTDIKEFDNPIITIAYFKK